MKAFSLNLLVLFSSIFLFSCSKSAVDTNSNPLDKEYKSLTSDNVNTFFLESAKVSRANNRDPLFEFNFKNLNYASEITRMSLFPSNTAVIWNYYEGDKKTISAIGNYNEGQYALRYILKDGRVLTSPWIKF